MKGYCIVYIKIIKSIKPALFSKTGIDFIANLNMTCKHIWNNNYDKVQTISIIYPYMTFMKTIWEKRELNIFLFIFNDLSRLSISSWS